MTPAVSLFTGRSALGKAISLNAEGTLDKIPLANSVCFVATVPVETASALADLLDNCEINQALALGTCLRDRAQIVVAEKQASHPNAIARTKAHFKFAEGPGYALFDIDVKDAPADIIAKVDRLGGVWPILTALHPPLATASRVRRLSQSACVRVIGEPPLATRSTHIYVLLRRGVDTPALIERLHQRLWLTGFGWIAIGAAGQLLERSLIDCAVASPERLIFEGPPSICDEDLAVDPKRRRVIAREGVAIMPPSPLSDEDEQQYEDAVAVAKSALRPKAEHVGYTYQRVRGHDEKTARTLAKGAARGSARLPQSCPLSFKGGVQVTVGEALLDPDRYVNRDCLDPIEPVARDYCARFLRGKNDHVCFVRSFAHGGCVYQLEYSLDTAKVALDTCPDDKRETTFESILNKCDFIENEARNG
jgi:hypothetical protein